MKITFDHNGDGVRLVVEREPMPPERFKAVCRLVAAGIGGAVFLVALKLVGVWAIGAAVAALVLVGLYRAMMEMFK